MRHRTIWSKPSESRLVSLPCTEYASYIWEVIARVIAIIRYVFINTDRIDLVSDGRLAVDSLATPETAQILTISWATAVIPVVILSCTEVNVLPGMSCTCIAINMYMHACMIQYT